MKKIWDASKLLMLPATQVECPRCKGDGRTYKDADKCTLCAGKERVWRTQTGWTLPVGARSMRTNTQLW
jgi:DnaJ-class molecular chaperone